jgi:hypothetical protein
MKKDNKVTTKARSYVLYDPDKGFVVSKLTRSWNLDRARIYSRPGYAKSSYARGCVVIPVEMYIDDDVMAKAILKG